MSATTMSRIRPVNGHQLVSQDSTVSSATTKSTSSIGSNSESSDPLESDYSDGDDDDGLEDDDENVEHVRNIAQGQEKMPKPTSQVGAASDSNDSEEDEDNDEEIDPVEDAELEEAEDDEEEDEEDEQQEETEESSESEEKSCSSGISESPVKTQKEYSIDDFQIIKTIGTGTFGRVCLCKDKQTDSYCAMKILAMADVIRLKQVDHVKNEKNILTEVNHVFIVNLRWSTKDDYCLYMLFEYVCGGELFSYLRNAGRFSLPTANFYASEIILALEYLHSLQIVYRDLKPENLLIDREGHMKITDFGFAKKLKDRTWTLCGTPEYLAPEIIQSKGHNRAVDWWALGVLIYEMLVGYPPFYDDNPFGIYEKILSGKVEWPRQIDPIAKDLIKKLLVLDRTKRMGNMKNGAEDVKRHRWFKHLDWNDVLNKKTQPPIIPQVSFEGDTSNFDDYPETDWKPARALDPSDMQLFEDF